MSTRFRLFMLATLITVATAAPARGNSISFSGTWTNGYVLIPFAVTTAGIVDMQFNSGYSDALFAFFDGSGAHLISADDDVDASSLNPHLTQSLGVGNYTLMVTYCCGALGGLPNFGSIGSTDGFNSGVYYFGTSTLASVSAAAFTTGPERAELYDVTISSANGTIGSPVPEPSTWLLLGTGLAALAARRRFTKRT